MSICMSFIQQTPAGFKGHNEEMPARMAALFLKAIQQPKQLTCYCSCTDFLLLIREPLPIREQKWLSQFISAHRNGKTWSHFFGAHHHVRPSWTFHFCTNHSCFVLTSSQLQIVWQSSCPILGPAISQGSFWAPKSKANISNVELQTNLRIV